MKTTTLTIRLSADDKQLLQAAARGRGQTVTEYLLQLVHADAGPGLTAGDPVSDLRAEMDQLAADLAELRDQIADLAAPPKRERKPPHVTVSGIYYAPGDSPDCNPSCVWYDRKSLTCTHPTQQNADEFTGDCMHYSSWTKFDE